MKEPVKKLPRKERERNRHRDEIIEAAKKLFLQKGFHIVTVEEIAQEAEFSVGKLYSIFRGKDELYQAVLIKLVQDFMDEFEKRVMFGKSPVDSIKALIEMRIGMFDGNRSFVKEFLESTPAGHIDPRNGLPDVCNVFYDRYINGLKEVFEQGMDDGIFCRMDPLYAALALEGIFNSFMVYWSRHEPDEPLEARVERLAGTFLDRICCNPVNSSNTRGQR